MAVIIGVIRGGPGTQLQIDLDHLTEGPGGYVHPEYLFIREIEMSMITSKCI